MALAAAALIASLGLIGPSAANACEWTRRPVGYSGYGYRYPAPPAPTFSFSFGAPAPVVIYRERVVRGAHAWGPPPQRYHREYANGRRFGYDYD